MILLNFYLHENENRRALRRERLFRDKQNPLEFYTDGEIRNLFRFNRGNMVKIINDLRREIQNETGRSYSLSPVLQVCIVLRFFATGAMQLSIGSWLNVGQGTISRTIWRVARAIIKIYGDEISMNVNESKEGFCVKYGLPNTFGAIDCTHVRILRPPHRFHPEEFLNRKNAYSINVQAMCDSECCFTNVVAAWPGSVHDSRVLKNSSLYNELMDGTLKGIILGDSGYPLTPFLLTPFTSPQNANEVRYNQIHKKARCAIERAFGQLKRRFHCVGSVLRCKLDRVASIITACFILHNLSKRLGEEDFEDSILYEDSSDEVDDPGYHGMNDAHLRRLGEMKRREIMELL